MEKKIFAILLILSVFLFGCNIQQPKYHSGGPYYYKSFANYYIPFRPVSEISFEEAKQLEKDGYAYFEAYFNDKGYITMFIKHYGTACPFEDKYYYKDDGSILREMSKSDGTRISGMIDKNGRFKENNTLVFPK